MKKGKQYATFDEYMDDQTEEVKNALQELTECILSVVPNANKMINYNIPAFALVKGGKRDQQIMIAGYKNHIGLYPHPTTMEYFWHRLEDYKKAKGSIQFPLSKPLPKELIIEMINYRKELIDKSCTH